MTKTKKLRMDKEREDKLKLFEQTYDHYEEKRIGDKWYIKSFNGGTKFWQVAVYSLASYERYKQYGQNRQDFEYKINKDDFPSHKVV